MSDAPAPPPAPRRRPFAAGCVVVVAVLLLCGGLLALGVSRGWRFLSTEWERSAEDERFAQEWTPPAENVPPGTFAPPSVAGFDLASSDENAAFPALGIDREGRHAVYARGNETIDVSVYRATDAEADAVFDEVARRIDDEDRFASTSHVRLPRSLRFGIAPPDLHGVFWRGGGWLVFVRSATTADLRPFLREYLTAVGTPKGDAAPQAAESPSEPDAVP